MCVRVCVCVSFASVVRILPLILFALAHVVLVAPAHSEDFAFDGNQAKANCKKREVTVLITL